jgi:hypothetical protein
MATLAVIGAGTAGLAVGPLSDAASATTRTTINFVVHETNRITLPAGFQATGQELRAGKVIGYYALTCEAVSASTVSCGVGASLAAGEIFARFDLTGTQLSGRVVGGSGAYRQACGTLRGALVSSDRATVTITLA